MSVLVFVENTEGTFKKSAQEVVVYASKVAQKLGSEVTALTIGNASDEELASLGNYGAKKVLKVQQEKLNNVDSQAYAKVIAAAAEAENADVVVMSYNFTGKAVAPRVAVKLKAGLVPGTINVPETEGGFVVKKGVFSGKAFANYAINTPKKVLALMPNSIPVEKSDAKAEVAAFNVDLTDADFGTTVKEVKKASGKIPLTEAEIVVSAGRGLKGPENWGMIEEMASVLGAGTACSRPVADMGWRPHEEHVGQTGTTVRPNLYIAIGISGAIQHLAGVNGSKVMVVINKDPEAPFFKAADYGIVGDAFEVVPKLTEAFKKIKAA